MSTLSTRFEEVPDDLKYMGSRGITSLIINKEVPALTNPLGSKNKIVVAPGMVTGSNAPTSGRLGVGGKSPLTGGIKKSNAGGRTPHKLARAGIKALIVEGRPSDEDAWYNIVIKHNDAKIVQANEYHNLGAYEVIKKLGEQYENRPGFMGSGIAGQMRLKGAGIWGNDIDNTDPGRYAGRGGLGAVLGSNQVIAIITDDKDGSMVKPVDEEKFKSAAKALGTALREHPVTGVDGGLQNYGVNVLMNIINESGSLPTKNWTTGHYEQGPKISGEAVHELIDLTVEKFGSESKGRYGHGCHPGCTIKCSITVPRAEDGSHHVAPLEYESACLLGSNLMIENLEHIAELNRLCNDLGLDTIETGNALGVAMEAGVIPWGDGLAAIHALAQVKDGTALGRVLGSGAVTTGQVYGVERVAHVKGQSMPAYDPRAIKGIGVTYATGPMGADHVQGYTIAAEILGIKGEVTDPRGTSKAGLSRAFQETTGFIDASGYCLFIAFPILDVDTGFMGMVDTCAAMFGTNWGIDDVARIGRTVLNNELDFNRRAGFTKLDDRLPEFMKTEAIAPHNVVFDVTDEELDEVHYPTTTQ